MNSLGFSFSVGDEAELTGYVILCVYPFVAASTANTPSGSTSVDNGPETISPLLFWCTKYRFDISSACQHQNRAGVQLSISPLSKFSPMRVVILTRPSMVPLKCSPPSPVSLMGCFIYLALPLSGSGTLR